MFLHWFIGFYACFVPLVFYFISGSNHQHQAQTSPFDCIHCSPKHRGLKEVERHSQAIRTSQKEAKVDPLDQNELEQSRSIAWDQKLSITLLKVARLIEQVGSGQEKCIQTSRASDHSQDSIREYRTSARLVERDGSGRTELIFTFCPIFEVSNVGPDGGSTGCAGFARVERDGWQQLFQSF